MSQVLILESIKFIEKTLCLVPPPPPVLQICKLYIEVNSNTIILVKIPYVTKVLEQ